MGAAPEVEGGASMGDVQILTLSCRDRPGITARVTGYLFDQGSNILEAQQFNDQDEGSFFMRVEFDPGGADVARMAEGFGPLAAEYGMHWNLRSKHRLRRPAGLSAEQSMNR